MLRRNCILDEIGVSGDGIRRHRCLVCGRETLSRYASDRVHVMCIGTPEEHAAWRAGARQRFSGRAFRWPTAAGPAGPMKPWRHCTLSANAVPIGRFRSAAG